MQKTVVMLKPDAFVNLEREQCDEFIKELPDVGEFLNLLKEKLIFRGLTMILEKKLVLTQEQIESHYEEHKIIPEKFNFLKEYISAGPVLVMLWEGENAIAFGREAILEIRGEFLKTPAQARKNMTHASDCVESANKEKGLYF